MRFPHAAVARLRAAAMARIPARRVYVKALHGAMIPLTFWFMIATPDVVRDLFGPTGAAINSDIALIFVALALLWSADYFLRGLVGRPGPKLSPRLKLFHRNLHRTLLWLVFLVPVGGFLLGLTSARLLKAGGWLPIAPPLGLERANEIVGLLHRIELYALGALVVVHGGFHVWRQVRLGDNALRIMAPKALHRFL